MFTTRKTRNVYHMLMVNKLFNSQMPRHLISDAHEWINEIPTVPTYWWQKVYTYHPRSHRGRWFAEIVWCTPRPDLPAVPPGLRSVVADFMGKSGGSEGGLSVPLIG
jgi:hypothetical protein